MPRIVTRFRRFFREDDGPTAVEYAVLLSLMLALSTAGIRTLGASTSSVLAAIGNSLAGKAAGGDGTAAIAPASGEVPAAVTPLRLTKTRDSRASA